MLFSNFFWLSICLLMSIQCEAVELRAIIHDSASICESLLYQIADYKGEYAFTDYIYINCNSNKNLNEEFLRIREYKITRWQQKPVVVIYKIRNLQGEGHQIQFYQEFETLTEGEQTIPSHFSKKCSFFRHGWEYQLRDMRIFVEEIDSLPPSIEVIANSQEEIFSLFNNLGVIEILSDSVPQWYCKYSKNCLLKTSLSKIEAL